MNKNKGIVYDCIVIYISKKIDRTEQVPRKVINGLLGNLFHIPKEMRMAVIKELVEIGYLEPINRDVYKVKNCVCH